MYRRILLTVLLTVAGVLSITGCSDSAGETVPETDTAAVELINPVAVDTGITVTETVPVETALPETTAPETTRPKITAPTESTLPETVPAETTSPVTVEAETVVPPVTEAPEPAAPVFNKGSAEVRALVEAHINQNKTTAGDYVILDHEVTEIGETYCYPVRYQMSDEEANEMIANGGMPSANHLCGDVTVNMNTGYCQGFGIADPWFLTK